jgi:hypothetical protein
LSAYRKALLNMVNAGQPEHGGVFAKWATNIRSYADTPVPVAAPAQFIEDFETVVAHYGLIKIGEYESAKEAAMNDLDSAIVCYASLAAEIRRRRVIELKEIGNGGVKTAPADTDTFTKDGQQGILQGSAVAGNRQFNSQNNGGTP